MLLDRDVATLPKRPVDGQLAANVSASLDRAVAALLARQHDTGWWVGEDEAN